MPLWKPLLLIAPAGLVLGMIGGHMAQPVLTQRASDAPLQGMFQTRAERDGLDSSYPAQTAGSTFYDGGYSYMPSWVTRVDANWSPPSESAWSYSYAAAPLPTIGQLDARQAALLADPDEQYEVRQPAAPSETADDSRTAPSDQGAPQTVADDVAIASGPPANEAAESASEPQNSDGQRALW